MFKRKPPEVELTLESFRRWLRAQRPDMRLFLSMSEMEQEALAGEGDRYVLGISEDIAEAQAEEWGRIATQQPRSEEDMLRQVSAERAQAVLGRNGGATSMSGLGQRRTEAELARKEAEGPKSFLGKAPDGPPQPQQSELRGLDKEDVTP